MKRETDKEPVRSKKPPLSKVRENYRARSATLQADQAIKHISESLLSQKKHQRSDGGEWGQAEEREWGKKERGKGERQTGKQRERKEDPIPPLPSPIPWSYFSHEDRPVRARVWNWAVTLSVCWSESESLSHLSPGNHSSLCALSGHHTNHSQASWD